MSEKDATSPPKASTKTSESPRDKDCTATVTLDTEIPIIITKSESKTTSSRTRPKDATTENSLSEQEMTLKSPCSQMATIQTSVLELTSLVKSNKRSLAESECDLDLPNAYQDFEPEGYSESAADYNLVDDNPEMVYIPTCPESEHEMFGEDELESEGDNETDLAVSQDTDIPELYFVGQDNTAKPVSEALTSFVTDAARKKLDPKFLEAIIQRYNRPLNCDGLIVPKTNVEIWTQLKKLQRERDLTFQKSQNLSVKAASAILQALTSFDTLEVKGKNGKDKCRNEMLDGLLLSAASVPGISMRRRDLQRPYISKAYRILASFAVPITTNLYGDNISKTISSITECNKLVRRISFPQAFDNRTQQYFHNRSQPVFRQLPRESLSTTGTAFSTLHSSSVSSTLPTQLRIPVRDFQQNGDYSSTCTSKEIGLPGDRVSDIDINTFFLE